MKRKTVTSALLTALLVAGAAALLFSCQAQTFVGDRVCGPDRYELNIEQMKGTDTHTLDLQAGDALQVTFATVAGTLQLEITAPDGSVLYSGNGAEASRFTVNISQSGEYTITVKAHHAQGKLQVYKGE